MGCIGLEAGGSHDLGRRRFGHAADIDLGTCAAGPFGDGIGHLLEMTV